MKRRDVILELHRLIDVGKIRRHMIEMRKTSVATIVAGQRNVHEIPAWMPHGQGDRLIRKIVREAGAER
jgi:hypothetical protein